MDIVEFLNRLASERMQRELYERITGQAATYACSDAEILATAIEVVCHA